MMSTSLKSIKIWCERISDKTGLRQYPSGTAGGADESDRIRNCDHVQNPGIASEGAERKRADNLTGTVTESENGNWRSQHWLLRDSVTKRYRRKSA